jgi:hypothetical protein
VPRQRKSATRLLGFQSSNQSTSAPPGKLDIAACYELQAHSGRIRRDCPGCRVWKNFVLPLLDDLGHTDMAYSLADLHPDRAPKKQEWRRQTGAVMPSMNPSGTR